jgi:hypothetical protein
VKKDILLALLNCGHINKSQEFNYNYIRSQCSVRLCGKINVHIGERVEG